MSKKQKHLKTHKPPKPRRDRQTQRAIAASPQVQETLLRLTSLRPDQMLDRLEQLLWKMDVLRQEPEFKDFNFDNNQLVEALTRHAPEYDQRIQKLEAKGDTEKAQEVYNDLRIAVIADLVTPKVRSDLQKRSERCLQRLALGQNAEKVEMAFFACAFLSNDNPGLPLGICALFITIYEESRQRAAKSFEVWDALEDGVSGLFPGRKLEDISPQEWLAAADKPEVADRMAQVMAQHPELTASTHQDYNRLIADVREDLLDGKIRLDFFTEEEIVLIYADLANMLAADVRQGKTPKQEVVLRSMANAIRRILPELMTAERNQQFFQRLHDLAQEKLDSTDRKQQTTGYKLYLAARSADSWDLGRHPLVVAAYAYDCEQFKERVLPKDATAEQQERFARLLQERGKETP